MLHVAPTARALRGSDPEARSVDPPRVFVRPPEAYAWGVGALRVHAECAQCGREAPEDPAELAQWRHGELALESELNDTAAAMILCPDCDADNLSGETDAGEAG